MTYSEWKVNKEHQLLRTPDGDLNIVVDDIVTLENSDFSCEVTVTNIIDENFSGIVKSVKENREGDRYSIEKGTEVAFKHNNIYQCHRRKYV
ncbi:hypothetical protein [Vibrio quintilis]|uniref:Uncharacterized protein n=1 Tax=Vibrio quintilis TaxID=1117707 RepID=A0A1M7YP84_9VIBR|nr:hypothetical protein [Vibrio quintilis]SHO54428.1 hypothetical protein VQ7734_00142 [Vibrio quintilis]